MIGSLPVMKDGFVTDNNLAIVLVLYFQRLPECPWDYVDGGTGWSQWAMDCTDNLMDRIIETVQKYMLEQAEKKQKPHVNQEIH